MMVTDFKKYVNVSYHFVRNDGASFVLVHKLHSIALQARSKDDQPGTYPHIHIDMCTPIALTVE